MNGAIRMHVNLENTSMSHETTSEIAGTIKRKLIHEKRDGNQSVIGQDEILSLHDPTVILGDPGLGKTVLTRWLGEQPGMKYVRAGTFVRASDPAISIVGVTCIVVDGLDEIASATPGSAIDTVLNRLSAIGNPRFVLSCRAADWLGAADRVKIEDDYGVAPMLLHLQPFTNDEAHDFLSMRFPEVDPAAMLAHLAAYGIESLYENPLTLKMLGEVAQNDGMLPKTRARLFERACSVMLREDNLRHDCDSHVRRDEGEMLLAAGAACAAQLLCGRLGIFTGPHTKMPDGYLMATDITSLPFADAVTDALKVRLFRSEGENRFAHVHRVIAEFLGARWLAHCFEEDTSKRRIFALFGLGKGVPASLRGLHAWIAHFSAALAQPCIKADPYAVLRYGNAETLKLHQARALLAALKKLSDDDPYFRSEDWGHHPVPGLLRSELKDEIRAIIEPSHNHMQLTTFLLEAMTGTDLASTLGDTLNSIMFDGQRSVRDRSAAATALYEAGVRNDWETVIRSLLDLNDPDSARLAFGILRRLGLFGVAQRTAIRTVLAYFGLGTKLKTREHRHLPDDLFSGHDPELFASWLDHLVETARPLMNNADFDAIWYVTRSIRSIAAEIIETDPTIRPERIWAWIGWLDKGRDLAGDAPRRLRALFLENRDLRAALLEHVLLTPCAEDTWKAGHRLRSTGLELNPTEEDLVGLLRVLRARDGDGRIDPNTWRDLLLLGRIDDGLAASVQDAAVEAAAGDAELLRILESVRRRQAEEYAEQVDQDVRTEEHRKTTHREYRNRIADRDKDVEAGDVHVLASPAVVYLGWPATLEPEFHFDPKVPSDDRLRLVLGEELAERVMSGFIKVLTRDDLPSSSRIVEAHRENRHCVAEAPMICGIMEMVRRELPLEGIERQALAAAYMAWQSWPPSTERSSVTSEMETALFQSESDWEEYFRTSIEPRLNSDHHQPGEILRLASDLRFSGLAGRLSIEWLRRYPALRFEVQAELMACMFRNARFDDVRSLIVDLRTRSHRDHDTRLLWLSADYVVDLENRWSVLADAAARHREFLWPLRDRIRNHTMTANGLRFDKFSIDHLVFIVKSFGTQWPNTPWPAGVVKVDRCNPSDASTFICHTINAIASCPDPEATTALQGLIAGHAPSYANMMKHALALQLRRRRDHDYSAPTIDELRSAVTNGLPESIGQMRAWFADRIEDLQQRIRGSNTDMWEAYWNDDQPQEETYCRNRLIEHIPGLLPPSIRFEPERHMTGQRRSDIMVIRNDIGLPVEIKGQWHPNVWTAARDQLDAHYTGDWQADGRGAYIVLWFGDVPERRKCLPGHPNGLSRPETPKALRQMLIDGLTENQRSRIDVFVLDLTRPK